jgi:hypothetical protein
VNRRLVQLGLALAAAPCAYAAVVYALQLVGFTGFAVRLGDELPLETWGQIGLVAAQMIIIAAALLIVFQGAMAASHRKAGIALAVAWLASAPLFILMLSILPIA